MYAFNGEGSKTRTDCRFVLHFTTSSGYWFFFFVCLEFCGGPDKSSVTFFFILMFAVISCPSVWNFCSAGACFFHEFFFALNWVLFYQITYSIIQKNISCMRVKFDLLVEESWWKILFFQRQSSHFKNCNNRCQTQALKSDEKYIARCPILQDSTIWLTISNNNNILYREIIYYLSD